MSLYTVIGRVQSDQETIRLICEQRSISIQHELFEPGEFVLVTIVDAKVLKVERFSSYNLIEGKVCDINDTSVTVEYQQVEKRQLIVMKSLFDVFFEKEFALSAEVKVYLKYDGNVFFAQFKELSSSEEAYIYQCLFYLHTAFKALKELLKLEQVKHVLDAHTKHMLQSSSLYKPQKNKSFSSFIGRTEDHVARQMQKVSRLLQIDTRPHNPLPDLTKPYTSNLTNNVVPAQTKVHQFECSICQNFFDSRKDMLTLNCEHFFCLQCLKSHAIARIDQGFTNIACPTCNQEIDYFQVENLLPDKHLRLLNKMLIQKELKLSRCPRCGFEFQAENRCVTCVCSYCFCTECSEQAHSGPCNQAQTLALIAHLESTGEMVAQCPGCKTYHTKDGNCEHVQCSRCRLNFCFLCSAPRAPILAHGNHYHRLQCRLYTMFVGLDSVKPECPECQKLSRICSRPVNLYPPRRFT